MTPSELAGQDYQEIGYVLFIEGWHVAFTNRAELAGGAEGWIGNKYGARTVALGLEVPQSIKLGIGIVDTGMLVEDDATFTIVDRDGHLIAFNQDEVGKGLQEALGPLDDPAPNTLYGLNVDVVQIRGQWVNGESIGPDGQRRQFQVLPGGALPGMEHAAISTAPGQNALRPCVVQTAARHWQGRSVALYLLRRDPVSGTWASWQEQFESGYSLLWWGTVMGLSAQAHAWKLSCSGPSSWLCKTLNTSAPATWQPFSPLLDLKSGEDLIAVALCARNGMGDVVKRAKTSAFTNPGDAIAMGPTPFDVAASINSRINALSGMAGADITLSSFHNAKIIFLQHEVSLQVDQNSDGSPSGKPLGITLQLRLHLKVWMYLGWDLSGQHSDLPDAPTDVETSIYEQPGITFSPIGGVEVADPPTSPFRTCTFNTLRAGKDWQLEPDYAANNGNPRLYAPRDLGGSYPLFNLDGQTIAIAGGHLDALYWRGQLAHPPADKELDSEACDSAGFIAIRGKTRGSEDDELQYQIARVSWKRALNDVTVEVDAFDRPLVWIEKYLDPRVWGVQNDEFSGAVWVADDLEMMPVAVLGYNDETPDRADVVLARLLLSSGSAEWSGVGPAATQSYGANHHADATGKADDRECADLGLCIPQELVDLGSFETAVASNPGGVGGPLNQTRLAFLGPFETQSLIEDIIKPRGLCFGLHGGRYGLFARWRALDLEDAQFAITPADIAGEPGDEPPSESVDFRPLEPVDLIRVSYGGNQLTGDDGDKSFEVKARDPRAWQRRGNAAVELSGRSLLLDGSWQKDFTQLWSDHLARWFADPKAMVSVRVKGNVAKDLWPGTVVSYTSPWAATRNGAYGMTQRVGRVVSVERDLQTLAANVEILVEGQDPTTMRRFGPMARLVDDHTTLEGRHDVAARTVTCQRDAFGRGDDASDVAAFAEPSWSQVGGRAVAWVWQSWDGVTWERTASFEVESVDAAHHKITYVLGTLTGTIWEKRFGVVVLAPYESQNPNQWPRATFGVVCGADGLFGAGNLNGFPWVE